MAPFSIQPPLLIRRSVDLFIWIHSSARWAHSFLINREWVRKKQPVFRSRSCGGHWFRRSIAQSSWSQWAHIKGVALWWIYLSDCIYFVASVRFLAPHFNGQLVDFLTLTQSYTVSGYIHFGLWEKYHVEKKNQFRFRSYAKWRWWWTSLVIISQWTHIKW